MGTKQIFNPLSGTFDTTYSPDGGEIFSGDGVPDEALGPTGAFYFDNLEARLYGPKLAVAVPAVVYTRTFADGALGGESFDGDCSIILGQLKFDNTDYGYYNTIDTGDMGLNHPDSYVMRLYITSFSGDATSLDFYDPNFNLTSVSNASLTAAVGSYVDIPFNTVSSPNLYLMFYLETGTSTSLEIGKYEIIGPASKWGLGYDLDPTFVVDTLGGGETNLAPSVSAVNQGLTDAVISSNAYTNFAVAAIPGTMLSGAGAPSESLEPAGSYYFDTTGIRLFGPKLEVAGLPTIAYTRTFTDPAEPGEFFDGDCSIVADQLKFDNTSYGGYDSEATYADMGLTVSTTYTLRMYITSFSGDATQLDVYGAVGPYYSVTSAELLAAVGSYVDVQFNSGSVNLEGVISIYLDSGSASTIEISKYEVIVPALKWGPGYELNPNLIVDVLTGGENNRAPSVNAVNSKLSLNLYAAQMYADAAVAAAPSPSPTELAIAVLDIDWTAADIFYKDISVSSTFTFSNIVAAKTITVIIKNTGASEIDVTFPTALASGTLNTAIQAGKENVYTFLRSNSKTYVSALPDMA